MPDTAGELPFEKFFALMIWTQPFPYYRIESFSCLRQGTLKLHNVVLYTLLSHFLSWKTSPFPYLRLLALQLHDSHLKISSVLCSSTRFAFPVRSSSCKVAGSASGIRISFNSLQLKSTIWSRKKKKSMMTKNIFSVLSCDTGIPVLCANIRWSHYYWLYPTNSLWKWWWPMSQGHRPWRWMSWAIFSQLRKATDLVCVFCALFMSWLRKILRSSVPLLAVTFNCPTQASSWYLITF